MPSCECLVGMFRGGETGRAYCPKHGLFGRKLPNGSLRCQREPFPREVPFYPDRIPGVPPARRSESMRAPIWDHPDFYHLRRRPVTVIEDALTGFVEQAANG